MGYDDPQLKEFENYYVAKKAGFRERAENWAVAIGLQQVDGLRPSKYLIEVAKKHIEGEISDVEATSLVDKYYESKVGHDAPEDEKEADRVAARINEVIGDDGFNFSPSYLIGLHGLIFEGVFPHAGSIREVNLRKREWVLRGESVTYGHAPMIERTLDYDWRMTVSANIRMRTAGNAASSRISRGSSPASGRFTRFAKAIRARRRSLPSSTCGR